MAFLMAFSETGFTVLYISYAHRRMHASIHPSIQVVIYLLVATELYTNMDPQRKIRKCKNPSKNHDNLLSISFGLVTLVCKVTGYPGSPFPRCAGTTFQSTLGVCLPATEGLRKKKRNTSYALHRPWWEASADELVVCILWHDSGWARDHLCTRCFWCLICSHNLLPVCACQPWQRLPCWLESFGQAYCFNLDNSHVHISLCLLTVAWLKKRIAGASWLYNPKIQVISRIA